VKEVARKYLKQPRAHRDRIGATSRPRTSSFATFEVEPDKKQELLEHLLGAETGSFLVFVRTKSMARTAWRAGWSAPAIRPRRFTATARRPKRNQALRSFSEGRHQRAGGDRRGRSRH